MAEIVLNGCYGGYGLSCIGVKEILKAKGYKNLYLYFSTSSEYMRKTGVVFTQKFQKYNMWYIATRDFGSEIKDVDVDYSELYGKYSFENKRTDPELIACIKTKGSKYMSSDCSSLYIAEYDDENFEAHIDEYDGNETLELLPIVSEKKMQNMSVSEICDYLQSLDINVKRIEK